MDESLRDEMECLKIKYIVTYYMTSIHSDNNETDPDENTDLEEVVALEWNKVCVLLFCL